MYYGIKATESVSGELLHEIPGTPISRRIAESDRQLKPRCWRPFREAFLPTEISNVQRNVPDTANVSVLW